MPRRQQIYLPADTYVVGRAHRQCRNFSQPDDCALIAGLLPAVFKRIGAWLLSYCLMQKAIHLTPQNDVLPVGTFMRRVTSRYARYVDRRSDERGQLFRRPYQPSLIYPRADLKTFIHYRHYIPVLASVVRNLNNYPHSSWRAYLGTEHRHPVHTKRLAAWAGLPASQRSAYALRRQLTETEIAANAPIVRFVGLKMYQKAGGQVRTDLIAQVDGPLLELINCFEMDRIAFRRLMAEAPSATVGTLRLRAAMGTRQLLCTTRTSCRVNCGPCRFALSVAAITAHVGRATMLGAPVFYPSPPSASSSRARTAWHATDRRLAPLYEVGRFASHSESVLTPTITRHRRRPAELLTWNAIARLEPRLPLISARSIRDNGPAGDLVRDACRLRAAVGRRERPRFRSFRNDPAIAPIPSSLAKRDR